MASKKIYDIVATVGTYQRDGEEKKRYMNCGSVFERDDGSMFAKLDGIPVTDEWSGWLSFFDANRDRGNRGGGDDRPRQRQRKPKQEEQALNHPDLDTDIPFDLHERGRIA